MASFTGQTIAATYKRILTIDSENFAADASAKYIKDGDAGTISALSLSTTRVGIGTDSPDELLHVDGGSGDAILRIEAGGTSNDAILQLYGDRDWSIENDGDASLGTADYFHIRDATANASRLVIDTSGNVGIGTAAPSAKFHLSASGSGTEVPHARFQCTSSNSLNVRFKANTKEVTFKVGDSTGHLHIQNNDENRLTIQDNGNVGIGTGSPDVLFHIRESASVSSGVILLENTYASSYPMIKMKNDDHEWHIIAPHGASSTAEMFSIYDHNNTSHRLVIDTDGNVGIGTITPSQLLDVASSTGGIITVRSNDTTISDTDALGKIYFSGLDDTIDVGAYINAYAAEAWNGGTAVGTDLAFGTCPNTATTVTERMRILDNGYVGIGTTSPGVNLEVASSTGNSYIEINANDASDSGLLFSEETHYQWAFQHISSGAYATQGDLRVYDYSDSSVAAHLSPGDDVWQSGSDLRIKKDIENIGSVLSTINNLRPVTWKRKYGKSDRVYPGLVAQEVLTHIPLVVSGTADSFKEIPAKDAVLDSDGNVQEEAVPLGYDGGLSIGYSGFVPYLIKAIQELSTKVTALENA